jgi:hypothetical protein
MVVEMDGQKGIITPHNYSANLNVLFTDWKYKGEVIKSFDDNRIVS